MLAIDSSDYQTDHVQIESVSSAQTSSLKAVNVIQLSSTVFYFPLIGMGTHKTTAKPMMAFPQRI
jgi:hypothetical protein